MQIYLITNKINGKVYIGQCQDSAFDRWCRHKYDARLRRYQSRLGNAILKYGSDAFKVSVLIHRVASKEILDYLEQYFIVLYDSQNPKIGYNITNGGDGSYGFKLSPEACAKMGKTKIGNKNCVGRIMSESTRRKISEANKRHNAFLTPEQRKRKKWTLEQRQRLSVAKTGYDTPERVKKFQDAMFIRTVAWG